MSELNEGNYKRIYLINWLLTVPLLVLFAWPYYHAARLLEMDEAFRYLGALIFATPFMITLLHGHITMAIGSVHRHLYYHWLETYPLTWGLLFHPLLVRTRFRLVMLVSSLLLLPVGYLLGF